VSKVSLAKKIWRFFNEMMILLNILFIEVDPSTSTIRFCLPVDSYCSTIQSYKLRLFSKWQSAKISLGKSKVTSVMKSWNEWASPTYWHDNHKPLQPFWMTVTDRLPLLDLWLAWPNASKIKEISHAST